MLYTPWRGPGRLSGEVSPLQTLPNMLYTPWDVVPRHASRSRLDRRRPTRELLPTYHYARGNNQKQQPTTTRRLTASHTSSGAPPVGRRAARDCAPPPKLARPKQSEATSPFESLWAAEPGEPSGRSGTWRRRRSGDSSSASRDEREPPCMARTRDTHHTRDSRCPLADLAERQSQSPRDVLALI